MIDIAVAILVSNELYLLLLNTFIREDFSKILRDIVNTVDMSLNKTNKF
jgi:hypothetical protein